MPGDTTPPITTPTRQIPNPFSSASSSGINPSSGAQYLAPSSPGRPEPAPHVGTLQIRRAGIVLTDHQLAGLFSKVKADDAQGAVAVLQGLQDPNVKDPRTGETLVHAAASSFAWRVIEAIATEPGLAHVVDEPVNGERALATAVNHTQFDPVLMSKWHRLIGHVDRYENRLTSRIGGAAKRIGHAALSPVRRPAPQDNQPVRLAGPEELTAQLRALIGRVDDLLIKESKDSQKSIDQADDVTMKLAKEFVHLDLDDSRTRSKFKTMMDMEGDLLQRLRPELDRWDNFFRALAEIALRPLRDPYATSVTIRNQATLDQDGSADLLIESLKLRQSKLGLAPERGPATAQALNHIMKEKTDSGTLVQMTQQQVLLAKSFFEQLPDHLLLDTGSLIRDVKAALKAADKVHGGREALLREIDAAIGKADALNKKADELQLQAKNTRPKRADTRPEAASLRQDAERVAKQAKTKRREAQQEEQGAVDSPLRQREAQVEALFKPAFDMCDMADNANPQAAGELRRKADELLKQAQEQAQALTVPVSNYRTLKLYVALEGLDPLDLEVHPRYLMGACLYLARQYTGRRDNTDKPINIFGDEVTVTKLTHARRQIMHELDFRLAKHLVVEDEQGQALPDTLLYRLDDKARSPDSSPTLPQHQRKISGSSPRFGRWLSPNPTK